MSQELAPTSPMFHNAQLIHDDTGGARAVEIAAMFGDSVIGVKHCIDPRSGKVSAATWGVLAAGVACVVASAIAFAVSVSAAADSERSLEAWRRAGRPAHAFRPRELGVAVDWVAFGGLALGLAGLSLGLARARRERLHPYYRIGTAPGVELAVESAPSAAFPLIAPSGDDFVFNYGAGIDGELIVDGKATPLTELAATGRARPSPAIAGAVEVAIPPAARIRAHAGQTTFVVSSVARPRRHAAPPLASVDGRLLAYVAGSFAVHLVAWGLLQLIAPDAAGVNLTGDDSEEIGTHWTGVARIEPPPDEPRDDGDGSRGGGGVEAAPMELPSGIAGDPGAEQADRRMQVTRTQDRPQLSREQAIQRARDAGILGSEQLLASITAFAATGEVSSGPDLIDVRGGIYGASGESWGNFAGGVSGLGMGGGCGEGPCGTIGTGVRYDTIGNGKRAGDGYRPFRGGAPGGSGRNPVVPRIGDPTTSGPSYDKSIVRRYIRRHIEEIGYCYDKQLLARAGIEGDIKATFLISPLGNVQSASATGFDADVASCLAAVIQRIEFPAPREGGVQVTYPFHFRAAGR
jgi:hypothetical protein